MASPLSLTKQELVAEIVQCGKDPIHFINKWAKIQHPVKGLVPFKTYEYQNDSIRAFLQHRLNIILKARQLGFTTVTAAFIAWFIIFNKDKNVLILSTKMDTAKNTIRIIRNIIRYLPQELLLCRIVIDNKQSIELTNGSRVKAITTSGDAGRSEAVSLLFIDEVAHIDHMHEIWSGIFPSISTGGRAILSSTPKGVGNFFANEYRLAQNRESNFNCRFGNYVNPYNPKERYDDRFMWWVHPDHDLEWFARESAGKSPRDLAQEHLCSFNTSGETFLPAETLGFLADTTEDPIIQAFDDRNLWIWKEPEPFALYVISSDVSSGFADDFSTFHVLRITNLIEQVAEYKGKIPADILGDLLIKVSRRYNNATIAPENNSGWSAQAIQRITESNYPFLYWSARHRGDYVDMYNSVQSAQALPGYRVTSANRNAMLSKMEQYIRNRTLILRSKRLLDEFRSFIWKGFRPDSVGAAHDDLIMALAGGVWVSEEGFMGQSNAGDISTALVNTMSHASTPVSHFSSFNHSQNDMYAARRAKANSLVLDNGSIIDLQKFLITTG